MNAIRAVTIDFWNTLFDSANGPARNAARREALLGAIRAGGHICDDARFDEVYRGIWEYFDDHWLNRQHTPTSHEMVCEILRRLEFELEIGNIDDVADIFSRGVLEHPPGLLPGAREGLEFLSSRGVKLALISDTAFSPGRVLRQLMQETGIAHHFSVYVFSDESGVAKPHLEAFRLALDGTGASPAEAFHIGDIERTDVRGAKGAGMKAVLYRGDSEPHKYSEETTAADATMYHWNEIEEIFGRLD